MSYTQKDIRWLIAALRRNKFHTPRGFQPSTMDFVRVVCDDGKNAVLFVLDDKGPFRQHVLVREEDVGFLACPALESGKPIGRW